MITEVVRHNLLTLANAYGQATGMPQSEVSRHFYGRGSFLKDLNTGKQGISIKKLDEVVKKFRSEWPKDTAFPLLQPIIMDRGKK